MKKILILIFCVIISGMYAQDRKFSTMTGKDGSKITVDTLESDYITSHTEGEVIGCGDISVAFDYSGFMGEEGYVDFYGTACDQEALYEELCDSWYEPDFSLWVIPEVYLYGHYGINGESVYDTVHLESTVDTSTFPPMSSPFIVVYSQAISPNGCQTGFGLYVLIVGYENPFQRGFTYDSCAIVPNVRNAGTIIVDADVVFTGSVSGIDGINTDRITDITYDGLIYSIDTAILTPGAYYRITDFTTTHYLTDGTAHTTGNYGDFPAPENVVITVDSALVNPVTYYYRVCFDDSGPMSRSLFSDEIEVIQGEDTDTVFVSCDAFPDWITESLSGGMYVFRGTESGVYGEYYLSESNTDTILSFFTGEQYVAEIEQPIHQYYNDELAFNTGATEPLIVFATSDTTIDSRVYSEIYPQDEIYYDWDSLNWLTDISFYDADSGMVDGFKGVITSRWDTKQDNKTGYDFRNVKFRRWEVDAADWDSDSVYQVDEWCKYSGVIYKSLIADSANKTPSDSVTYWRYMIDVSADSLVSWNSTDCNGIPVDADDYDDFYTFGTTYNSNTFTGNHIGSNSCSESNVNRYLSILNNIVFYELDEEGTIYGAYNNTFEPGCFQLTFGGYMNNNTIGAGLSANTIGAGMSANTIGASMNGNSIGIGIQNNVIGEGIAYNTIGAGFDGNTVGAGFTMNQVDDAACNTIDFTLATHVYAAYNKKITLNKDSEAILIYYDGDNNIAIVNAND